MISKLRSKTIRVFISSTFHDMSVERNELQRTVFREMREKCAAQGWQFEAVDLRWGVSEEASITQRTMQICLAELERCQKMSPRPNFLILLGQRYGWRPIPEWFLKSEADRVLARENNAEGTKKFHKWYKLDKNASPEPCYILQDRTGAYADNYDKYRENVEIPLATMFQGYASGLEKDDPLRIRLERSATEQEIQAGAFAVENANEHVLAFFREIENLPKDESAQQYRDMVNTGSGMSPDTEADGLLTDLKTRIQAHLPESNHEVFTTTWDKETNEPDRGYLPTFIDSVRKKLVTIIDNEIENAGKIDKLDEEIEQQRLFAIERANHFQGRIDELDTIKKYLNNDSNKPLVIYGESGTGKSALLAEAAKRAKKDYIEERVIERYMAATATSSEGTSLLQSIWQQLDRIEGVNSEIPQQYSVLSYKFADRLRNLKLSQLLILIIDALDQLPASDPAHDLAWLPRELHENCRIVLSTLPGDDLDRLREQDAEVNELCGMKPEEGEDAVDAWLDDAGRRLKDEQKQLVLNGFVAASGAPLYLRLAFEQARLWRSYDPLSESLPTDIPGIIDHLFESLAKPENHGSMLVELSLSLLYCARRGLSGDEMVQVLALDDDYWDLITKIAKKHGHTIPVMEGENKRIPAIYWTRLYHDLLPYLTTRSAPGGQVIAFYHRQVRQVVQKRFVDNATVKKQRMVLLSDFFRDKWQLPDTRALDELPRCLNKAELYDELTDTLCNLDFIQNKSAAKLTYDLVKDVNLALEVMQENQENVKRERKRQARLDKYTQDLIKYAKGEIETLEVPQSITPWSEEKRNAEIERIRNNPNRADKLRDFQNFLGQEADVLHKHAHELPHLATQQAWNFADSGPVGDKATNAPEEILEGLLLRIPSTRPPHNPLPAALKSLYGHTKSVSSVAVTPDGKRAVSGSFDATCIVWDLETGEALKTLSGLSHINGWVHSIAITPDGKRAVSASYDSTCTLWNLETGKALRTLSGHKNSVNSVAVTLDGKKAVSASLDNTCILWDLETGKALKTLAGHFLPVNSVAVTLDGRKAVSASNDKTCIVWDLETGNALKTLSGHANFVYSVTVTLDGKKAVSASQDKTCIVWDLETGNALKTLSEYTDSITFVAVTADGKKAVTASGDKTSIVWDLETGKAIKTLSGLNEGIESVAVTPDGNKAVSTSDDKIFILDLETGKALKTLSGHTASVRSMAVTPNGNTAILNSWDGTCLVWDLDTGKALKTLSGHTKSVNSVAVTPDGKKGVSASVDKTCIVWDLGTGEALKTLSGHTATVMSIAVTPDGKQVISASWDKTCILWNLETGKALKTISGNNQHVYPIAVTPDGKHAVLASLDNTSVVWDLETGKILKTLSGNTPHVDSVTVTPDGKMAVSTTWNHACVLRNLETGEILNTLLGHTDRVYSISVTPDGKKAVSASVDKTCIVWDLETGKTLKTLFGHTGIVSSVAVSPDGKIAVSVSDDKSCIVWDLENGKKIGQFFLNKSCQSISVSSARIVCGGFWEVFFLPTILYRKAILTPRYIWDSKFKEWQPLSADCPFCGHRFSPPAKIVDTIRAINRDNHITPEMSPCMELPDEAWEEPELLSSCPKCGGALKYNPFIVDNRSWE